MLPFDCLQVPCAAVGKSAASASAGEEVRVPRQQPNYTRANYGVQQECLARKSQLPHRL